MQVYRVGGAVRDERLGLPVKDIDWVVVGARPDDLLSQGYTQVGADFPVFLHPDTKEEYALARTERKTGSGYHGFESHFDPGVTLEEDLSRRDLTINAMAQSEDGRLIDPYHGQADLDARVLRHVTDAFVEDPLRVLRVARFLARFAPLGFTVAPETRALMQELVQRGEMQTLTPERVWRELSRALQEQAPAAFIECLQDVGALDVLMPELATLFGVPQNAAYHPEIDTGVHVLMTLRQAAALTPRLDVRFAALVHDLGKGLTPRSEWPRHIRHEERGIEPVKALCEHFRVPKAIQKLALHCTRFHLQAHKALELRPVTVMRLLEGTDALRNADNFEGFLLACEADARGRQDFEDAPYPQADYLRQALAVAQAVSAKDWVEKGYQGQALGEQLRKERIRCIRDMRP